MRKDLICLCLAAGMLGAAGPAHAQQERFPDVRPGHWAHDAVADLAGRGLLKGYPGGTYQGRRALTRFELAAALERFSHLAQQAIEDDARQRSRLSSPPGPRGRIGDPGAPGVRGPAGPQGPRGAVPAEWEDLLREQQRLRDEVSQLRRLYGGIGEELRKLEVQDVWAQLDRLSERTRRTAKPIPGILRR